MRVVEVEWSSARLYPRGLAPHEVFFRQGFEHNFEVYGERQYMGAQDYRMELWVPIVKVD